MALFRSPHKNFRQKVHDGTPERHPVTGDVIGWKIKKLAANFGTLGAEQTIVNPETGSLITIADIQGGFYDSRAAQERENLTDDEREMIERKLREVESTRPDYVQEIVPVHVPAPLPWQTYNELSAAEVVEFAPKLKLVSEALRYERENGNRPEVTTPLEGLIYANGLSDPQPIEEIPADQLKPMAAAGVTLQSPPRSTDSGIPLDTPGFQPKSGSITV